MTLLRRLVDASARNDHLVRAIESSPLFRPLTERFVAGRRPEEVVAVAEALRRQGLAVSLDRLGEAVFDEERADAAVAAYDEVLARLEDAGLAEGSDLSVKLSALGSGMTGGAEGALSRAREIARRAGKVGATVTIDMEGHETTDAILEAVRALRAEFPSVGTVLQASLRRTADDVREAAEPGRRVRLCKGAYDEPATIASRDRDEVRAWYLADLGVLMSGPGYPMVATHDPVLVAGAEALARAAGRGPDAFEFQMLYGVRPDEQARLAARGFKVRVYVPFGDGSVPYLLRRLGERPANLALFLRALGSRG